jgi:hypothetical protein
VAGHRRQRCVSWDGYFLERDRERRPQHGLGKARGQDAAKEELRKHVSLKPEEFTGEMTRRGMVMSVAITIHTRRRGDGDAEEESNRECG